MCTTIKSLKPFKVLFIGLVLSICVPLFAVSVWASENLVPTDMRQWETINALGTSSITYYAGGQGNEITLTPTDNIYFIGITSGVDYIAGHTYNLSFGSSYNEVQHLIWGFGYRTSEDTFQFLSSSNTIKSTNKMSFVAPDTVNSVYVIFVFDGTSRQNIQINHLLCVDVTASEQQAVIDNANENTNKIGGWFTSLFDNIKGLFYTDSTSWLQWTVGKQLNGSGRIENSNNHRAIVSDFFLVDTDNIAYSIELPSTWFFYSYKYSSAEDTSYISRQYYSNPSAHTYTFDKGYYYRFMVYAPDTELTTISGLNEYLNGKVYFTIQQSIFDRMTNLILYFDSEGHYTNPFTFGNIDGVSEYVSHIQGAFDGFNDGINDFVAPIGVVNAVLDEVVGEWGFIAVAVTFVLSALVLIRFLGV